jgi:hypothetical protein
MKLFRNTMSVLCGIVTYAITEYIAIFVLGFVLSIPVLSQIIRMFIIPSTIFIAATAPSIATQLAMIVTGAISKHEKENWSGIVAFALMNAITIVLFVMNTMYNGFEWINLFSAVVKCGFFVFAMIMFAE